MSSDAERKEVIPLFKVFMSDQVDLNSVLKSGYIGEGCQVKKFEEELKSVFNYEHLLTVNSCTSALQLALHLLKRHALQEVLTTPLTCFATTSAILANDMQPSWVDIDPLTGNMCLDDLESKITYRTKIIIIVHFAGFPIDYDKLEVILNRSERRIGFRPVVIEDCAHAWGSLFRDRLVGTYGHLGCFSFQAVKNLTTGDGGLLVLPEHLYARAKKLRWFGLDRDQSRSQDIFEAGFKYHMNDIAATIGLSNLKALVEQNIIEKQRKNLAYYHEHIPQLTLQKPDDRQANGWLCCLQVDERERFEKIMRSRGVEAAQPHYRNDAYSCLRHYKAELPNLDGLEKRLTCIPCGWWVDPEFVVDQIKKGW